MNILILCSHPVSYFKYHDVIDTEKNRLFLFISSKIAEMNASVLEEHKDRYELIRSFENYNSNGLVELEAIQLHKKNPMGAIVNISEVDVIRAGRLRDYFKIPGQSYRSALAFRDKIVMKQNAQKAGLRVPNFAVIKTATDLIEFIDAHKYPVYVKPMYYAGSLLARSINNDDELRRFLLNDLRSNDLPYSSYLDIFEVEEYTRGDFYNINGVVKNRELVLYYPARYNINTDLENIQKIGYWSSQMIDMSDPLYALLKDYIKKLLRALPTPQNTVFHAEVFMDAQKRITLCEIASRLPGGGIALAMDITFGINLFALSVQLDTDPNMVDREELIHRNDSIERLTGSIFVHPKEGTFLSAPETCPLEFVNAYFLLAGKGARYANTGIHSCDGVAVFVVSGKTEEEVERNIDHAVQWFWDSSSWQSG